VNLDFYRKAKQTEKHCSWKTIHS